MKKITYLLLLIALLLAAYQYQQAQTPPTLDNLGDFGKAQITTYGDATIYVYITPQGNTLTLSVRSNELAIHDYANRYTPQPNLFVQGTRVSSGYASGTLAFDFQYSRRWWSGEITGQGGTNAAALRADLEAFMKLLKRAVG